MTDLVDQGIRERAIRARDALSSLGFAYQYKKLDVNMASRFFRMADEVQDTLVLPGVPK